MSDTYPMFIEPTITWVFSGISGYMWLDTKIVLKKDISHNRLHQMKAREEIILIIIHS